MKKGRTAIVPGSFDPITVGHIDIVKRAAQMYETVYLAVMINSQKEYLFSLEERKQIAQKAFENYENIEVISSEGMLWKLAYDLKAEAIVKGYRNETDYEYEMKMAEFNRAHNPDAKTILLECSDGLCDVSSTEVRKRILQGKALDDMLPEEVAQLVYKYIERKNISSK